MKHKTSQPFLLHKHSVISCAIAKGGALRERRNVRTSGGSISLVGNGIAYNGRWFMPVQPLDKTNEPHGLAKLGGVSGENETNKLKLL